MVTRTAGWSGAAIAALVVMLAPRLIAGIVLFSVLATVACWIGWSCMADARKATDDRADLVVREPRRLPRVPDQVRHARLPPPPRLPRVSRLPPELVPPGVEVIPGSIHGWFRPPKRKV